MLSTLAHFCWDAEANAIHGFVAQVETWEGGLRYEITLYLNSEGSAPGPKRQLSAEMCLLPVLRVSNDVVGEMEPSTWKPP